LHQVKTYQKLGDQELVSIYRESSSMDALGELVNRYSDLLYGVGLKYLKNPESASDVVMDIFEELVQKLKHHQVDNFKGWLHTVAKNHCLMKLRSDKKMKVVDIPAELMQSGHELHLNGVMHKEQRFQFMEQCIESLPATQRTAIELFYLQNKCYKEITDLTGKDWNTIRSNIQNGRRNLKLCIEKKQKE
jgi:RNA polymerase sigma factor (sigma-70 family)